MCLFGSKYETQSLLSKVFELKSLKGFENVSMYRKQTELQQQIRSEHIKNNSDETKYQSNLIGKGYNRLDLSCSNAQTLESKSRKIGATSSKTPNRFDSSRKAQTKAPKLDFNLKVYSSQELKTDLDENYIGFETNPVLVKASNYEIRRSDLNDVVSGLKLNALIICLTLGRYVIKLNGCEHWKISSETSYPKQQSNGTDCGVFTCLYAKYLAFGRTFDFSQDAIANFRKIMTTEIMKYEFDFDFSKNH
ncbi:unnamed protein product [Brachionus calyciflorus]|uniref:Ubiquitin-like protease family profile domain-containing protein n=1 Tax=Brachionus calyciflorus TaxID=104777 RepID=A0A813XUD2_9BILA|nr:unnamed protein product [Brachionus calyciflorus]